MFLFYYIFSRRSQFGFLRPYFSILASFFIIDLEKQCYRNGNSVPVILKTVVLLPVQFLFCTISRLISMPGCKSTIKSWLSELPTWVVFSSKIGLNKIFLSSQSNVTLQPTNLVSLGARSYPSHLSKILKQFDYICVSHWDTSCL